MLLLDWSKWLRFADPVHREIHEALTAALVMSGATLLNLDVRELGAMTEIPAGSNGGGLGTVVYDNTPGGCGHVRELMRLGREWLEAALRLLRGSREHDDSCEHGCLRCILSFGPGTESATARPNRRGAREMLFALLKDDPWLPPSTPAAANVPSGTAPEVPLLSQAARILRRKLASAIRSAKGAKKTKLQALLDNLSGGLIEDALLPLITALVEADLPLPEAGAELPEAGETVDLLWTKNGERLVVLSAYVSGETPGSKNGTTVIYAEDDAGWMDNAIAWLTRH